MQAGPRGEGDGEGAGAGGGGTVREVVGGGGWSGARTTGDGG